MEQNVDKIFEKKNRYSRINKERIITRTNSQISNVKQQTRKERKRDRWTEREREREYPHCK